MARSRRSYRAGAIKGWVTRRLREIQESRIQRGKEKTVTIRSTSPAAIKAQRARDIKRIERDLRLARRRRTDAQRRANARKGLRAKPRPGAGDRPTGGDRVDRDLGVSRGTILRSLQQLDTDYGDPEDYDYEEIDVETSPDYARASKGGR